jgi:LmbE family N-acetylglucosaminyl deacetylase
MANQESEMAKMKLSRGKIRGIIIGIAAYVVFILIFVYLPKPHHAGKYREFGCAPITINKTDRVLVVSPHPDDAALSSSGIIQKCIEVGAQVKVLYITCGSHNTDTMVKKDFVPNPVSAIALAKRRNEEAVKAMETLGLKKSDLIFLGFPDFGTLKIWTDYFGKTPYFDGLTLHDSVFCKYAYKKGVPFTANEELSLIEEVLKTYKPTKIFYSTTYDLNSDHRATGLFIEAAVLDIEGENPGSAQSEAYKIELSPCTGISATQYVNGKNSAANSKNQSPENSDKKNAFHPALCTYFMHAEGWPVPDGYHPDMILAPPAYVYNIGNNFACDNLSKVEEEKKEQAIKAHKSQVDTKPDFMLSFVRKNEIFLPFSFDPLGKPLPVWSKEVCQKFGITPFVSNAEITEDANFVHFHITLFEGMPPLTKLNIFVFPYKIGTPFVEMPKYRLVISHLAGPLVSVKLYDRGKGVYATRATLRGSAKDLHLDIEFGKKYLDGADGFFSAVMVETGVVRTSETPWWCISLQNTH